MSTKSYWHGDGGKGEIVEIGYDPKLVSYADLVELGGECGCADTVFAKNDAQLKIAKKLVGARAVMYRGDRRADKQPKYYLYVSDLRSVPMTEQQAVRVNAVMSTVASKGALIAKRAYAEYLSPRQLDLVAEIRKRTKVAWPNLVGVPLSDGWQRIAAIRRAN